MARSVTLTPTLKLAPKRHTYSTRLVEMSAVCSPSTANEKTPAKPGSAKNTTTAWQGSPWGKHISAIQTLGMEMRGLGPAAACSTAVTKPGCMRVARPRCNTGTLAGRGRKRP